MTFAQIKNSTRGFIRKKHQTDSSLFDLLQKFASKGYLIITATNKAKVVFKLNQSAILTGPIAMAIGSSEVKRSHLEMPNSKLPTVLDNYANVALGLRDKPVGQRGEIGQSSPRTEEIAKEMLKPKQYDGNFKVDLSASENPDEDFG